MSFVGALTVLDTHLVAAGAAISPAITDVSQGERSNLHRRIDYYVTGIGDPTRMGGTETLTDRMFGVTVACRVYIPVPDRSETLAANIEADLYAVSIEIAMRVLGDGSLGDNCTALRWEGTELGWLNMPGWLRVATTTFTLDFVEQITLAL